MTKSEPTSTYSAFQEGEEFVTRARPRLEDRCLPAAPWLADPTGDEPPWPGTLNGLPSAAQYGFPLEAREEARLEAQRLLLLAAGSQPPESRSSLGGPLAAEGGGGGESPSVAASPSAVPLRRI